MKLNINWKNLAKAVGITAAFAAVLTAIGFLIAHAPWVLVIFVAGIFVTAAYCVLDAIDE